MFRVNIPKYSLDLFFKRFYIYKGSPSLKFLISIHVLKIVLKIRLDPLKYFSPKIGYNKYNFVLGLEAVLVILDI